MPADPLQKVQRLERLAIDKLAQRREQARQARVARWRRLQTESPDTAEWISTMSEFFGKPAGLEVKFEGERWEQWK